MRQKSQTELNYRHYALKESAYAAALPFITGTLLQVFLMNRGVDTLEIGMINAAVNLVQVAATILTSDWAERKVDICRSSCKTILLQAIIYPCFVVQAA